MYGLLKDNITFYNYSKAGLIRFICEDGSPYQQYTDHRKEWGLYGHYADYFAGRITFPVNDINGKAHGMVGRRLDNRGRAKWLKQQTEKTAIRPKGWLYGINKAAKYIARYKTVIIVEGIFDYLGVYQQLQDIDKPFIVSTLGTSLTAETTAILKGLNVEHYIIAYDWDEAGRAAITKIARDLGSTVYYLGGMKEGTDPADHFKNVVPAISGFSMQHLMDSAKKYQPLVEKPIYISHITAGPREQREILLKPLTATPEQPKALPVPKTVPFYYYQAEDFLPLLRYDHGNKTSLDATLSDLIRLLNHPPEQDTTGQTFRIKQKYISMEFYDDLGPGLILWLAIAIEQQRLKRYVHQTDSALAKRLYTSRKTICRYKALLKDLGYLRVDTSDKIQKLSVSLTTKED